MMIYLSGPVFTLAERRFNEELASELERLCPSLQVFLPQRYDKELQNEPDSSKRMFACLMGRSTIARSSSPFWTARTPIRALASRRDTLVDEGKGWSASGLTRSSKNHGLNLMLLHGCSDLLRSQARPPRPSSLRKGSLTFWRRRIPCPPRRFVAAVIVGHRTARVFSLSLNAGFCNAPPSGVEVVFRTPERQKWGKLPPRRPVRCRRLGFAIQEARSVWRAAGRYLACWRPRQGAVCWPPRGSLRHIAYLHISRRYVTPMPPPLSAR